MVLYETAEGTHLRYCHCHIVPTHRRPTAIQRDGGAAQQIAGQIRERPVDSERDALPGGVVVGCSSRGAASRRNGFERTDIDRRSCRRAARRLLFDAVAPRRRRDIERYS
jgi:hypothetical protein